MSPWRVTSNARPSLDSVMSRFSLGSGSTIPHCPELIPLDKRPALARVPARPDVER